MSKMGAPEDIISQELNVDKDNRNMYHHMLFRGNFECLVAVMCLERTYMKKTLYDEL